MSRKIHLNEGNRGRRTLTGACAGLFLLMLDSTVVTLALASLQRDLDASTIDLRRFHL